MRQLLIAAAALAVGGLLASSAARAEPVFYPGGPVQQGNLCQVYTGGDQYYGFWAPCPAPAKPARVAAGSALDYVPATTGLYYQGGPVRQGGMCQISTDGDGRYGYWAPCAK